MTSARPKLSVVLPPDLNPESLLVTAQLVEECGFDGLWLVEDLGGAGGVAQTAAVLAATSRLEVGLGILPAGARNVAFAAMEIGTLAGLFPGRVTVGIGHGMPGWMRQVGTWPASPLQLLREYLSALRALLSGEDVTVSGDYVQLDGVQLSPAPRVLPPLLAGVRGPRSIRATAELTDGLILAEPVTRSYLDAVRAAAGRPLGRVVGYAVASVDADTQVARDAARRGLSRIGEPDWAPHLASLPFAGDLSALRDRHASPETFAAELPDAWVDELAVTGNAFSARDALGRLHGAGYDEIGLIPQGDLAGAIRSLADLL